MSLWDGQTVTADGRTPAVGLLIRDRGALGRIVEDGMIENVYRLQIMNTDESAHHYRIGVTGIDGISLQGAGEVTLNSTESRGVAVNVRTPEGAGAKGSNKIWFTLVDTDNPDVQLKEKAVFFVPR